MKHVSKLLGCLTAVVLPLAAQAADYPDRTVTLIVGAGPGSSNDIFARYIADGVTKAWGQPVAVENMPRGAAPWRRRIFRVPSQMGHVFW